MYFRYSIFGLYCLFINVATAIGAGIAVMEHSVKELGQAFSGAPTNTKDGSVVFFNPAAMSHIKGRLFSFSGYVAIPSVQFSNNDSQLNPLLGVASLIGNNGGNAPRTALIPNFYYVHALSERFSAGLGISVPFGMQSNYHPDWVGRYQAIDSELATINFNPSASIKITERISIGAGLNIQYLESKLSNAIDFGSACFQILEPLSCTSQDILPQTADGRISLKGNSIGLGYNVGIFYTPTSNTYFGASYRSKINHQVHSSANFTVPENAMFLTQNNIFVDTSAKTSVTLPDHVLFGFLHRIGESWTISADAMWTRWSHIQVLRTQFSSAQPDDIHVLKWKDTWRYAIGVSYSPMVNQLTFRTGFAYDESPVPGPIYRSPRIPDSDRYWLTAGLSYAVLKNIILHAAYAHLFINDASIDRGGTTGDRLTGKFSEHINIVGLQLDWRF